MFKELFYPRQAVLITAANSEKTNVTSVDWITPISEKPPMVAFSLRKTSLTLDLLSSSMEFAVAIPSKEMAEAVVLCGATSGKYIDKFAEASLTQAKAKKISAPLIAEAIANLECKVLNYTSAGDHILVAGEVLEVSVSKEVKASSHLFFDAEGKKVAFESKEKQEEKPSP